MQVQSLSVEPDAFGHKSSTALNVMTPPSALTGACKATATTAVKHEPIHAMLENEPIQTMFKNEPTQAAPLPPAQPEMLTQAVSTAGWLAGAAGAQPYCYGFGTANSKRSRPGTLRPVEAHPRVLDLSFSENHKIPPAMNWQARKRPKSSTQRTYGVTQIFICGYCDQRKASTSRSADERVRIRCKCGGQHQDGKLRMHATWTLVEDSSSQSSESEQICEQTDIQEWIFVDETQTQHKHQAAIMCAAAS